MALREEQQRADGGGHGDGHDDDDEIALRARWISVNFDCGLSLSAFLARDDLDSSERDALTELMFQRTAVDFNQLNATLNAAGFCDVEKVRGFGLFNDTSAVAFRGERLALNVVARACRKEGQAITVQFPGMET